MNPLRALLFLGFIAISFASCKDDKQEEEVKVQAAPKLQLEITPVYGDQAFEIGTVYTTNQSYRMRVETMKTYISDVKLMAYNGDSTIVKDIAVHDFATSYNLSAEIKEGVYNSIKFSLGVPADRNKDQDPSQYPNSHPLSVAGSSGMFWTWNSGYIFTKFDGRLDLSGQQGAALIDPFAFHSGDDRLFRTVELPVEITAEKDGSYSVRVKFDVKKIIDNSVDPIDLSIDFLTHTTGNLPLATRFVDNLASSFTIE
jgi:hypothetical protein